MPFLRIADRGRDLYYTWTPAPDTSTKQPLFLVFIHGLGSSSSFFVPIIPGLASAGYSCLALDSHGAGLTPFTGQDGGIEQIVKDISAAMSALSIAPSRTIIVGHSMGGIAASEVALRYQTAGAVLLGPVLPSDSMVEVFTARIKLIQDKGMDGVADVVPVMGTGPKSTPMHRAFIRALLLSQKTEGYISNCKAIGDARPPEYSKIKCPLLIIAGSHDKTCPIQFSQTILERWGSVETDKRIQVLDQIGHWHCIEAAEEVLSAILQFANEITL